MKTCHGSTASARTRTRTAPVVVTATMRDTIMIAQRLARSATMPEIRANASMGTQRNTKSRAT